MADVSGFTLSRVADSRYWSVSLKLPAGRAYNYAYIIDGETVLDPINPRRRVDASLNEWSYFWTDYCRERVSFENWEADILRRLTRHILPFQSKESQIFLNNLDPKKTGQSAGKEYRLDLEMGVVNFIDKLVAGPELRQLSAYKSCLKSIDTVLRGRNPYLEPKAMSREIYETLYDDMAANSNLGGWDYNAYQSPSYFLKILRRHAFIGAFSHPKYGGNGGAFAWDYLHSAFPEFDWGQAVEQPLGTSTEYLG